MQMMVFAYDHRGIIKTDRLPCGTTVTTACYHHWMHNCAENAQIPTSLARGWATHFARQCTPTIGEGCDRFAK